MGMTLTNNTLKRIKQTNPEAYDILKECWDMSMGNKIATCLQLDEILLRANLRDLITIQSSGDIQRAITLIKQKITSS